MASDDVCSAERLLELVRTGEREALDRLTRCYGEKLLIAGRKHCRTTDEAEDAVQDALLSASDHLDEFRGEGSFEGWLVRIVARACRRLGRGQKNDPSVHDSEATLTDLAASPELDAERRELAARLDQALLALSPEDRLIVLLAELEDHTALEISEKIGLSPGAVRTRLSRLRARLRTELASLVES